MNPFLKLILIFLVLGIILIIPLIIPPLPTTQKTIDRAENEFSVVSNDFQTIRNGLEEYFQKEHINVSFDETSGIEYSFGFYNGYKINREMVVKLDNAPVFKIIYIPSFPDRPYSYKLIIY